MRKFEMRFILVSLSVRCADQSRRLATATISRVTGYDCSKLISPCVSASINWAKPPYCAVAWRARPALRVVLRVPTLLVYPPATRNGSHPNSDSPERPGTRMSLQAELIRIGVRLFIGRANRSDVPLAKRRESMEAYARRVPEPPAGTTTTKKVLGIVPAMRIARPQSDPGRIVFFLHGGGYVAGGPALYRQVTW